MTEQFLHRANVIPVPEQMHREGVPKRMAAHTFGDAGLSHRVRNRSLHHRLVQMIAGRRAEPRIPTDSRGRKHELPPPLRWGIRVLPFERVGKRDTTQPSREIVLVPSSHLLEMLLQIGPHRHRQRRGPIFRALSLPNDNLAALEVNVLHAQLKAFAQPQSRTVLQHHDRLHRATQLADDRRDLVATQHDRQPLRRPRPHDRR